MDTWYFASPYHPTLYRAFRDESVAAGFMGTPSYGVPIGSTVGTVPEGIAWGADNECFTQPLKFGDGSNYMKYLESFNDESRQRCKFATAPDVVGDFEATLERSNQWYERIRSLGYPPAVVLQNGATVDTVPWDQVDAVFVGGDTEWKLSNDARLICLEAFCKSKWVHMGRVNSMRRMALARSWGCNSVDGTYVRFGPDVNAARVVKWIRSVNGQQSLFNLW